MSFPLSPIAPLEAARRFVQKISKPSTVLVAISGGSDSTGLLVALHQAVHDAGRHDLSLHAVTIDHALRAESADEANGVAALCATLAIPHHLRCWDAPKPATGLSAAARLARYALIGAVADEIAADMVVVGHTLGDQQETIAMRGARSERQDNLGLAGMADAVLYDARHWIMRPFLNVTRQDIRDFLVAKGQSWYDDPSNDDAKYERVRVRNGSVDAEGMLLDQSINRSTLSSDAAQLIERYAASCGNGLVALDAESLTQDPTTLRYALSALACVIGGRRFALGAASMDKVLAFAMSGALGRVTASRVVFDRRKDALYLMRENRGILSVIIPAGTSAIWDERFDISNDSPADIAVRGFGAAPVAMPIDFASSAPPGVAKRAAQAMPVFIREGGDWSVETPADITVTPRLAPYDLFLPRFDVQLASAIATLLGRSAYPLPPV